VIGARAAHERLMKIVAHGVLISEALEERGVARLYVIESHGIAAAVVVDGGRRVKRIDLVRIVRYDEGIKIVQAARRIVLGGILDVAIRLLPHLEEPVRRITGVGIVGKVRPLQWEWSVR